MGGAFFFLSPPRLAELVISLYLLLLARSPRRQGSPVGTFRTRFESILCPPNFGSVPRPFQYSQRNWVGHRRGVNHQSRGSRCVGQVPISHGASAQTEYCSRRFQTLLLVN